MRLSIGLLAVLTMAAETKPESPVRLAPEEKVHYLLLVTEETQAQRARHAFEDVLIAKCGGPFAATVSADGKRDLACVQKPPKDAVSKR